MSKMRVTGQRHVTVVKQPRFHRDNKRSDIRKDQKQFESWRGRKGKNVKELDDVFKK